MSSAKDETHAVFGTFFYAVFTAIISLWPWIITALCAVIVFPGAPDPEKTYPMMMTKVLPPGLLGICVMSLIGAFMSTVDTHLNLGASYFINDIYRRFINKNADERHYVRASRISVVLIMLLAIGISLMIESVASAWLFILTFASGAGLTWILRWFWWRVNAYTELSAMITSGAVATYLKIAQPSLPFGDTLLTVIAITTPVFLLVTYLTPPTDDGTLRRFYERVQPGGLGWRPLVERHGLRGSPLFGRALNHFWLGVVLLFASNLGVGYVLLKSAWIGAGLILLSLGLTWYLVRRVKEDPLYERDVEAREVTPPRQTSVLT